MVQSDPMQLGQPFFDSTYYQILYVEPSQEKNKRITTSILAKTRGNKSNNGQTSNNTHPQSFDQFELDEETINNLENHPRGKGYLKNQLSSYLPSPGVVFPQGFIDSLSKEHQQTELSNFYVPMRFLLHSRKLSQLIAKTWWSYLEVKNTDLWDKFTAGKWDAIDHQRTPFNIGQTIQLEGFKEHEAQPLLQGLTEKVSNPQTVLKEVLAWTSGQPFLTQKLCKLIRNSSSPIPTNTEAEWIENLVRRSVIENWESQDEPEHLRTIRDRVSAAQINFRLI